MPLPQPTAMAVTASTTKTLGQPPHPGSGTLRHPHWTASQALMTTRRTGAEIALGFNFLKGLLSHRFESSLATGWLGEGHLLFARSGTAG